MPSYIGKIIVFFTIFYTLLIPSTIMHAFAEGYINHEETSISKIDNVDSQVTESSKKFLTQEADKKGGTGNTSHTSEYEHADAIGRNIQMAGNILSSSSSELAEQAKSYALGKVNSTISSEAQKWLSQSGTAKINFGFDRKGRLENNSVDLLLPIYDNQAAWFFFSQLGYRNKDSRNTVNLGLGGRYFSQNWMYGLNTFYDYDITGKNRRIGLGGELWGDYIKFSTNGYYRLSDWQISRNFEEHHERPANGYDINGEFFLSAYPNLGGKFSYEQYFGDNVTLFNRKTKQKNPSLAKIGVTYTPIPLITMGVDYKQGERGQSETQFLTNFNLRFGVPLSAQLSPDNVASMRTLAGSRYDLVERNNHIVLDHREVPKSELSVPGIIVGYSREIHDITKELSANTAIQQINIEKGNAKEEFIKNGGDIYLNSGRIYIKFPEYLSGENKNNSYALNLSAELKNDQKTKPQQMKVIVRPFEIKKGDGANFTPPGPLLASGDQGYTFNPIITFDTPNNPNMIKNATIHNVEWFAIPVGASASEVATGTSTASLTLDDNICNNSEITDNTKKLEFKPNSSFKQINIMNDGHIAERDRVTLMSTGFVGAVAVCVAMDSQPRKFMGKVVFDAKTTPLPYHIKEITVTPAKTITADGKQFYTYTAQFVDNENHHLQKKTTISGVKWNIKNPVTGLTLDAPKGDVETDETGKLQAKLTSTVKVDDVMVSLAIEGHNPVDAERTVSFKPEQIKIRFNPPEGKQLVNGTYDYTVTVTAFDGTVETNKDVTWGFEKDIPHVTYKRKSTRTDDKGQVTATITSSTKVSNVVVTATVDENTKSAAPVEFDWPTISKPTFNPEKPNNNNNTASPGGSYELMATVEGIDGVPYTGKDIQFEWSITEPTDWKEVGLCLLPSGAVSTDQCLSPSGAVSVDKGTLNVTLKSTAENKPTVTGIKVCVNIINVPESQQCITDVNFVDRLEIQDFEVNYKPGDPILKGDGNHSYTYTAKIVRKGSTQTLPDGYKVKAEWITDPKSENYNGKPEWEIQSDNKIKDGKITGTLTSRVGIGDVKGQKITDGLTVELKVSDDTKKASQQVAFEAISQIAGIKAFSDKYPDGKIFLEKNKPYNAFENLKIKLIDLQIKKPVNISGDQCEIDGNMTNISFDDKECIITFYDRGESSVEMTVKKSNKAIYKYSYEFKVKKYFFRDAVYANQITPNTGISCFDPNAAVDYTKDITQYDLNVKNPNDKTDIPLTEEFPHSFRWGILSESNSSVIVPTYANTTQQYLFDLNKDQSSGNDVTEGYLLCVSRK